MRPYITKNKDEDKKNLYLNLEQIEKLFSDPVNKKEVQKVIKKSAVNPT